MKEIRAEAKNIRGLLGSAKYAIDYYQREYRWEQKQIVELLDDLAEKFQESHDPAHERSAVEGYGHYFLGSIIISDKEGHKYVIDGQQRLTSLTLLLVFLHRHLDDSEQRGQLTDLVFSQKFGVRSFNLDVSERTPAMDALFNAQPFDDDDQPESVVNILGRFADIEDHFPEDLRGDTLPFFTDWLIENVHLVRITAYSDADAYTIFETMNDRGLSLTPTDMLKGYLLAHITDAEERKRASEAWRRLIAALQERGKEEDADALKAWLRGQHAVTIRERKRDATPQDFDLIGTEFHRWVRDHEEKLGLTAAKGYARFIERELAFFARWYQRLRAASETLTEGLEAVYYNARNGFTLQYPLLLAPLTVDDPEEVALRKVRLAAGYLDIVIARRIWNGKSTAHSTMSYNVYLIIQEIRRMPPERVAELLLARLDEDEYTFMANDRFALNANNRKQIHRLLARMTDFLETRSGRASRYAEYTGGKGKKKYEVEHVWADHFARHADEFDHAADFADHRNRIGGLLLLPKSFNASYGDDVFATKRDHYVKQNLLALSLHEKAYESDPGFRRFVRDTGLPFEAHPRFRRADLDARQALYQQLAGRVWNPENLRHEASGAPEA